MYYLLYSPVERLKAWSPKQTCYRSFLNAEKIPGPGYDLNPSHMKSRHVLGEPHHPGSSLVPRPHPLRWVGSGDICWSFGPYAIYPFWPIRRLDSGILWFDRLHREKWPTNTIWRRAQKSGLSHQTLLNEVGGVWARDYPGSWDSLNLHWTPSTSCVIKKQTKQA